MTDLIHNYTKDNIADILHDACKFIEWDISPKFYHLETLIQAIKNSLIYFLPEDESLIKNINSTGDATIIINTFTEAPHPLKEGLIALRGIFQIINSDGKIYTSCELRWLLDDYLEAIKPYVLEEKVRNYSLAQSKRASKKRVRGGLSPKDREERDNEIRLKWEQARATNKHLKLHSYAINNHKKYNIGLTQFKKICNNKPTPKVIT